MRSRPNDAIDRRTTESAERTELGRQRSSAGGVRVGVRADAASVEPAATTAMRLRERMALRIGVEEGA